MCQSRSYAQWSYFPPGPGIALPIPVVLNQCNFRTHLQVLLIQALSIKAKTIKTISQESTFREATENTPATPIPS